MEKMGDLEKLGKIGKIGRAWKIGLFENLLQIDRVQCFD
jgi:hypothetical protein